MNQGKPWHEDDDFWEMTAPLMFTEARWTAAQEEIDRVVALLGLEAGASILDLCCGPGRHSLELARRGYAVTGVDRTAAHLEKARKRAEAEGLTVEFVQEDVRRFCRPEAFDGAVNLFTSFGYFEDPADDALVAANIWRSLRGNGRLVMDVMGKEVLARKFRERDWDEQNGVIRIAERKICKDWTWIENRWIILRGEGRREFKVSHRLYSAAELRALLLDCGFESANIYDHEAKRLVAVAHK